MATAALQKIFAGVTDAQISALGQHQGVPLVQDVATGEYIYFDGATSLPNKVVPPGQAINFATYGDSRANWGTISSGFDSRVVAPAAPTGTVAGFTLGTGKAYLQFLNPSCFMVGMCGVSGDTVQNLITRESAAPSSTRRNIDDIVSVGANIVIVWMGINSITSLVAGAYSSAVADTIWGQIQDVLQRLVSKGLFVIDNGDGAWEHTDTTTYPPTRAQGIRDTVIDLNARRKAYAATTGGRIVYNDTWSLFSNPDGTWRDYRYCVDCAGSLTPPASTQLVHPSNPAGILLADSYNKIIRKYFGVPHPAYTRYFQGFGSTYNLLPNADLSVAPGGVGTGWSTSVTGNSPAKTDAVIVINGKRYQSTKGVFAGAGANILTVNAPMPIQSGGSVTVTAGQTYGIEFDVYIDDD
jgi:hypothetical protein